nr:MAG TPA: hypothetical protein [Bacteriophage sp.]DAV23459.1 MAG TPA: hypothetical protein [Bacteriophage sp.]DAZ80810.1 MAG TPA: hypothetical protein [Caudoviricetes sp.]
MISSENMSTPNYFFLTSEILSLSMDYFYAVS